MIVVEGYIENINEVHLPTGFYDRKNKYYKTYEYPRGQHLRGAFGYLAKFLGAKNILRTYESPTNPSIFFKDALPIHYDRGIFEPIIAGGSIKYRCTKCGEIYNIPAKLVTAVRPKIDRESGRTSNMVRLRCISPGFKFRLKIIALSDVEQEVEALIKFIEKEGFLNIGKRWMKGMGEFKLFADVKNVREDEVLKRAEELQESRSFTIKLLSDAIVKENGWATNRITEKALIRAVRRVMGIFWYESLRFEGGIKLVDFKTAKPVKVYFKDVKENQLPRNEVYDAVPRGSEFTFKNNIKDGNFFIGLALLEMFGGIGKRISFGKGEIKVVS